MPAAFAGSNLVSLPGAMPHNDAIVVMTTLSSTDEAVKLVRALLERCSTPAAR